MDVKPSGRKISFEDIFSKLAKDRPLFYSEADFQHALGWRIHQELPSASIRFEYPYPGNRKIAVDIWLNLGAIQYAIELKYCSRGFEFSHEGEIYNLKNHGAQDIRRYDILKDLQRVQNINAQSRSTMGVIAVITNEPKFWRMSREGTVDASFSLSEGRSISGELAWAKHAGEGTTKGRKDPIIIRDTYKAAWRPYSTVGTEEFRYLLFQVGEGY